MFTFIYLFFYKTQMNDVAFSVSLINLLHVTKFKHYESLVLTRILGPERHMNLQDQEKKQKQKKFVARQRPNPKPRPFIFTSLMEKYSP